MVSGASLDVDLGLSLSLSLSFWTKSGLTGATFAARIELMRAAVRASVCAQYARGSSPISSRPERSSLNGYFKDNTAARAVFGQCGVEVLVEEGRVMRMITNP